MVHKVSDWTDVFFHRLLALVGLAPEVSGRKASHTLAVIMAAISAHNPKPMLTRGTCRQINIAYTASATKAYRRSKLNDLSIPEVAELELLADGSPPSGMVLS